MRNRHRGIFLSISSFAAAIFFISSPEPVGAQCGSSASSCRNCHEIRKIAPVDTKGIWHTEHAFGDFCAFCHSGNTKAKDEAAAHAGMVDPLANVKEACQSCHPNDYMERAKKYAVVLGKPIGTGISHSKPPPAKEGASSGQMNFGPLPPTGGTVIDLNKVYAGLDQPRPKVSGNAILIALIIGVAFVFAGLVFYYEKPVPRFIAAFRRLLAAPAAGLEQETKRPEIASLMPILSNSDADTLRAVARLLSDRESGPRVLKALSHLDLRALASLGEADHKALALLLTLAREMKP